MFPPLSQNPNTRPPYSDVNLELDYYVGQVVERLGIKLSNDESAELDRKLKCLTRAMLRVRAVLDPQALTAEDWEKCKQDACQLEQELRQ